MIAPPLQLRLSTLKERFSKSIEANLNLVCALCTWKGDATGTAVTVTMKQPYTMKISESIRLGELMLNKSRTEVENAELALLKEQKRQESMENAIEVPDDGVDRRKRWDYLVGGLIVFAAYAIWELHTH